AARPLSGGEDLLRPRASAGLSLGGDAPAVRAGGRAAASLRRGPAGGRPGREFPGRAADERPVVARLRRGASDRRPPRRDEPVVLDRVAAVGHGRERGSSAARRRQQDRSRRRSAARGRWRASRRRSAAGAAGGAAAPARDGAPAVARGGGPDRKSTRL